MNLPFAWPSFRLSLSIYLPPFTLTLGVVPGSSIDDGAAAAGYLSDLLLISALDDLDSESLALFYGIVDAQAVALSLLTIRTQQIIDAMDVDEPGDLDEAQIIEHGDKDVEVIYPAEPQPADTLVLPGKHEGGVYHAIYKNINKLTGPGLKELCKQYSLATTGNKTVLKERISGFSQDKSRWQHLLPNARRSHCGVRDGGITKNKPKTDVGPAKTKKLKPSVLRRNKLMGLPLHAPLGAQLFASERSKDMQTLEEKSSLLRRAKEFDDAHPHIPCEELYRRKKLREEQLAKEKADNKVAIAENLRSMSAQIASLTATIQILTGFSPPLQAPSFPFSSLAQYPYPQTNLPLNPLYNGLALSHMSQHGSSFPSTGFAGVQAGSSFAAKQLSVPPVALRVFPLPSPSTATVNEPANTKRNDQPPTNNGPMTFMPTANTGATLLSVLEEVTNKLTVGHGKAIFYKYSQVHEPCQISFVTDIARLDCVWDDEQPNWDPLDCGRNLLEINGTPIALKYWKQVFSCKNDGTWSWLKRLWVEWKYVAERYRSSSSDQFWQEYSYSNGVHYNWKAITDRLRDLRSERDQHLVDQAKAEYGDNFGKIFVNNRGKVLTDKPTIARHYLNELAKRSL
ncbi:MAG: hypothetical protein NXY57DRAFT_1112400 [Lentinula lateritia]|nr:MAG: hypothetical protein NXY57DRAFT_1112400 [Lentinula lateritia]